jgi:hypothetical protein
MAQTKKKKTWGKLPPFLKRPALAAGRFWLKNGWWRRIWVSLAVLIIICLSGMYGIARWYIAGNASKPIELGASFIPAYARFFGLDPKETMSAMIDDAGFKQLRLVSYWDEGEPTKGAYNFTDLDWEFQMAEQKGAKISLSVGLRQPRWPECHMPSWAANEPASEWYPQLNDYITAVVNRYKNSPALNNYQLENEYFLKAFGQCIDFSRDRLVNEYKLVKGLDPKHTLVVSMSNNAIGTPIGAPKPDEFAVSVYKRVWDKTITRRYYEYPFPAWYYAFRAGWTRLTTGRDSYIHELQAEAWPAWNGDLRYTPLSEEYKSMNAQRLHDRFQYGEATGMKEIDLWGVEWWYWLKVKKNDPSMWNAGKQEVQKVNIDNAKLLNKN